MEDENIRNEQRSSALTQSYKRFKSVAKKMLRVYGLRLPHHLAVFDAFCRSLSEVEQNGLNIMGMSPSGIMRWFDDDGLSMETIDGLDPRLDQRYHGDPPELVTIINGDTDGLHFGLWYEDPACFPSFIVRNYARDSAWTFSTGCITARELLAQEVAEFRSHNPAVQEVRELQIALEWFLGADTFALEIDGLSNDAKKDSIECVGGCCPALPRGSGNPRCSSKDVDRRQEAYEKNDPVIKTWIANARKELDENKPAFAFIIGRELFWYGSDDYRDEGLELLEAAYKKLDRQAFAEIARVHFMHRRLDSVSVYKS